MHIYDFVSPDDDGRIVLLRNTAEPGEKWRFYVDSAEPNVIRLERVKPNQKEYGHAPTVDKKRRITIPCSLRKHFKISTLKMSYDEEKDEIILALPKS